VDVDVVVDCAITGIAAPAKRIAAGTKLHFDHARFIVCLTPEKLPTLQSDWWNATLPALLNTRTAEKLRTVARCNA
jgi:hypothetical protein